MTSRLNPYISFKGNARQAMEFYESVFGGKLASTRSRSSVTRARSRPGHALATRDRAGYTIMAADYLAPLEYQTIAGRRSASAATTATRFAATSRSSPERHRRHAAGEAGLGGRVRHVHGQVRHRMAGEHRAGVTAVVARPCWPCEACGQDRGAVAGLACAAAWPYELPVGALQGAAGSVRARSACSPSLASRASVVRASPARVRDD